MKLIMMIQNIHNPLLDQVFQYITMIGEPYFTIIVMGIVLWCIDKEFGYKLGFILLSGAVLNVILKLSFHTVRPIGKPGIRSLRTETATGYSFPSGHSQNTAQMLTSLIIKIKKTWFSIIAVVIMLLVGISRLYLGVHWPIDVIFGLMIGILWSILFGWLFEYANRKGNDLILLLAIIPIILTALIFPSEEYLNAASIYIGFFIGYIIENNAINFDVRAKKSIKVLRFMVGVAGILAIEILLKNFLPAGLLYGMLRYGLIGIFATAGAPYIFKKFVRG